MSKTFANFKKDLKLLVNLRNYPGNFISKLNVTLPLLKLIHKKDKPSSEKKIVSVNFLKFHISGYEYRSIEYLLNEVFISNEYYFESKNEEPIIIDCGANIGVSILYFLNLFPKAKITGFEANPYAFKVLQQNMEDNNLNVVLENCALCNADKLIPFYFGENYGSLVGSILNARGGKNKIEIQGKKLSGFLLKYDKVDLIKIDVEGAEHEIIEDLYDNNLLHLADNYLIEYHLNIKDNSSSLAQFLGKFEECGFKYNIKTSYKKLGKFQDVFIHFYKK